MNKFFAKLFITAVVVSIAFSACVATARAAISIQLGGVANGIAYNTTVRPTFNAVGATSVSATLNGGSLSSGTAVSGEGNYLLTVTAVSAGDVSIRNAR